MRKCVSCGQWMGHVQCLKGQPEQCTDCVTVPLRQLSSFSSVSPAPSIAPRSSLSSERPPINSNPCRCSICIARYSNCSLESSSEHNEPTTSRVSTKSLDKYKQLKVSIPRRLLKSCPRSLVVSVPLKRLQGWRQQGHDHLRVTVPRTHVKHSSFRPSQSPVEEQSGPSIKKATVHSAMKVFAQQHPGIKVLTSIRLPRYSFQQLLDHYKLRKSMTSKMKQPYHYSPLFQMLYHAVQAGDSEC